MRFEDLMDYLTGKFGLKKLIRVIENSNTGKWFSSPPEKGDLGS